MKEFNPRELTEDQMRLCHNEYTRRWKLKHKDLVSMYNIENYKKRKGIKKDIVIGEVDASKIALQPII